MLDGNKGWDAFGTYHGLCLGPVLMWDFNMFIFSPLTRDGWKHVSWE